MKKKINEVNRSNLYLVLRWIAYICNINSNNSQILEWIQAVVDMRWLQRLQPGTGSADVDAIRCYGTVETSCVVTSHSDKYLGYGRQVDGKPNSSGVLRVLGVSHELGATRGRAQGQFIPGVERERKTAKHLQILLFMELLWYYSSPSLTRDPLSLETSQLLC